MGDRREVTTVSGKEPRKGYTPSFPGGCRDYDIRTPRKGSA